MKIHTKINQLQNNLFAAKITVQLILMHVHKNNLNIWWVKSIGYLSLKSETYFVITHPQFENIKTGKQCTYSRTVVPKLRSTDQVGSVVRTRYLKHIRIALLP